MDTSALYCTLPYQTANGFAVNIHDTLNGTHSMSQIDLATSELAWHVRSLFTNSGDIFQ